MRHPALFYCFLSLLSMLGFLATDMYLPAFDAMRDDLHTSANIISASLSLYLAGFACAQLLWGPLSDKLGRKPVLLMGLSLFAISCLALVWVNNPLLLLVFRFLQATGVCAAAVCWQSLVIDYYPPARTNKIFASIMPLVALSPALAPLLGAWIINHASWRVIFLVLTVLAVILLALTLYLLRRPGKYGQHAGNQPAPSVARLFAEKGYSGNIIIYAACSASFFSWLTGSPFILSALGMTATDIGLSYIPQTITFLIGGFGCRALLNKYRGDQILPWLLVVYFISVGLVALAAFSSTPTLWKLLVPFCGMAMANGAIYPTVVSKALSFFPEASGKAAGIQNTFQLGLCFIFSAVVSAQVDQVLHVTALCMLVTAIIALIGYRLQKSR